MKELQSSKRLERKEEASNRIVTRLGFSSTADE